MPGLVSWRHAGYRAVAGPVRPARTRHAPGPGREARPRVPRRGRRLRPAAGRPLAGPPRCWP